MYELTSLESFYITSRDTPEVGRELRKGDHAVTVHSCYGLLFGKLMSSGQVTTKSFIRVGKPNV